MPGSLLRVYLHLVWSTWNRLPLLVEPMRSQAYASILLQAEAMACEVLAIGGIEDHVHVLVRMSGGTSLSALAKQMKGVSSHLIARAVAPHGFFRWQGGYGAFSVSPRHVNAVIDYIRHQPERHRTGNLVSGVEPVARRSA